MRTEGVEWPPGKESVDWEGPEAPEEGLMWPEGIPLILQGKR